jgi:hypothetical protein
LPTLDGDNWRNQGSAAPKIAGEVVRSSWLRIQSVNRVFGLTLTQKLQISELRVLVLEERLPLRRIENRIEK